MNITEDDIGRIGVCRNGTEVEIISLPKVAMRCCQVVAKAPHTLTAWTYYADGTYTMTGEHDRDIIKLKDKPMKTGYYKKANNTYIYIMGELPHREVNGGRYLGIRANHNGSLHTPTAYTYDTLTNLEYIGTELPEETVTITISKSSYEALKGQL